MTKINKLKRKQKYQYNINRKRLNKKRLPNIESTIVKNAWDSHTSSRKNFKNLGLVYDVNHDIKNMNREDINQKEKLSIKKANTNINIKITRKSDLGKNIKLKGKNFRFSKDQVHYLSYLLQKYGDDYKAMSKDRKNYLQHTWKQIRYKINLFKSIPDHYNEFLKNKEMP